MHRGLPFAGRNQWSRIMKKWIAGILMLAISTTMATADVIVNWTVGFAGYDHTATDLTGSDNALLDSYAVTWQLIYAGANNLIDAPDLSNGANGWVGGDDSVWATRTIAQGGGTAPQDGTQWDRWMTQVSGNTVYVDLDWAREGYLFQRVFEGAPAALSWYFDSSATAIDTSLEIFDPPQELHVGPVDSGFQPNQQLPVPEPTTMALLGLGMLALVRRRR